MTRSSITVWPTWRPALRMPAARWTSAPETTRPGRLSPSRCRATAPTRTHNSRVAATARRGAYTRSACCERDVMSEIRVLVVDDHPVIRDSLSRLIEGEADMTVVATVGTVDETYTAFRQHKPDVVIMDIALTDAHGLDLLQNILAEHPDPAAVIFSMYDERTYAERAIRNGARGYVMKSAPTRAILDAIRTTHRGDFYLSAPVLSRILRSMSKGDVAGADRPFANLTDREMEVYQLLGQGLDLPTIARQLIL